MARFALLDALGDPIYRGLAGEPPANPDPDPPPPDPPAPGSFTHGSQIFRNNVGRPDGFYAGDTRTALSSFSATLAGATFTSADNNAVVNNVHFTNNVACNADNITFKYCLFEAPASDVGGKYLFTNDTGRVRFEDCTFVGRYGHGKTVYQRSTGGLWFRRCLILGSEDIIHAGSGSGGSGPQPYPTEACTDFTGARIVIEECFLGDGVRYSSGHIDCIQFDTNGPRVGNLIVRRSKLLADSINSPSGPRASTGDPTNPANGCLVLTHGTTPGVLGYFSIEDSVVDGGNLTINASPPDGPAPLIMAIRNCKVGHDANFTSGGHTDCRAISRYGSGMSGTSSYRSGNTWLASGTYAQISGGASPTPNYYTIVAGDPVDH
jgi:hypothetical protein